MRSSRKEALLSSVVRVAEMMLEGIEYGNKLSSVAVLMDCDEIWWKPYVDRSSLLLIGRMCVIRCEDA